VTTTTISPEQFDFARNRVAEAGLSQLLNFGFFFATAHDARLPRPKAEDAETQR